MKDSWRQMMEGITRLTRAGRLREATAAIQRALGGQGARPASASPAAEPAGDVIDVEARVVVDNPDVPLPEVLDTSPHMFDDRTAPFPEEIVRERERPAPHEPIIEGDGEFIDGVHGNAAGTRPYKLFIPSGPHEGARPLLVMLHGCKQNPADFAAGTRMNELAQAQGWLVLYPGQQKTANQLGCWNWFQEADQQRGRGEPSIIADMTREIARTHGADPRRIFVAGLSAGGAMAAIMATTYPELFAAAGIHSGLPHAAANDLVSALKAMKQGPSSRATSAARGQAVTVPTIVFHGDRDTTVHPCNGDEVIAQARFSSSQAARSGERGSVEVQRGQVPGGHAYSRKIHRDESGRCDAEHWIVHGAGHAWAGGSKQGSYTDPLGPDASREMLRFFDEHPMGERSGS